MIAKGTLHDSGAKLAAYMATGKDGEEAQVHEVSGFASDDIREAFRSIDAMAKGSRMAKPFFHVQVRNPAGERLTRQQWVTVADRIERVHGLRGQGRAIAFHIDRKTGHEHMHVAWSRLDGWTLKSRPLPFFKQRLKAVSRELEIELGLTRVSSSRPRPEMAPRRAEEEQSRRLGTDLRRIRSAIRSAWEQSDSGKAFMAALAEHRLVLCRGDRRDFVVVDRAGGLHTLGKRLLGESAEAVRRRLSDLASTEMPTVDAQRARQRIAAVAHAGRFRRQADGRRSVRPEVAGRVKRRIEAARLREMTDEDRDRER